MAEKVDEKRIREVVAKCVVKNFAKQNEEDIKDSLDFIDDLGGDSLDVVEFIMLIENVFHVEISGENEDRMRKVGDIVEFLLEKNLEKPLVIDMSGIE